MFDWNEFKILAEKLKDEKDEASQRTSISRLYYAVYWKARLTLEREDQNLQVPEYNAHKFVWDKFSGSNKTRNAISRKGRDLRRNRNDADYEADIRKPKELVDDSFQIAENILFYLNQIQPKKEN